MTGPCYLRQRPLVVCGLPRSGTSLTRDLLNTAAGLLVFDEFPAARFSHLFDFARQLLAADKGRSRVQVLQTKLEEGVAVLGGDR